MYKLIINSFLFGIIYLLNFCYAKTIEDPIAKHDASQCGIYLCKSLPSYATEYIQSGCLDNFNDYLQSNIKSINEINLPNENLIELSNQSVKETNINTLITLSIISFSGALFLGYIVSINEKKNMRTTILIQNKEF